MCVCSCVTYHQRQSSEHHDQQNDHWSDQHLRACREEQREPKSSFINECSFQLESKWMFVDVGFVTFSLYVNVSLLKVASLKGRGPTTASRTQMVLAEGQFSSWSSRHPAEITSCGCDGAQSQADRSEFRLLVRPSFPRQAQALIWLICCVRCNQGGASLPADGTRTDGRQANNAP